MGMLDISEKDVTLRKAVVEGKIFIKPEVIKLIKEKKIPKGDVLKSAEIAGILASKRTDELIPLCHPIPLEHISLDFEVRDRDIVVTATAKASSRTGVEMEAFMATTVALLTIYDMTKSLDRGAIVTDIRLLKKSGGKSGTYERK